MRKIVIAPTFASYHFLKCWLKNIIDSINPDVIILNEGIFPQGPENKGHITHEFKKKWCYTAPDTSDTVGFDWVDTVTTVMDICLTNDCKGHLVGLKFKENWDANKCFLTAISAFHKFQPQVGDIIFPLEPDAFLLESDKYLINDVVSKLKPGEGISCKWMDFLETQLYTENVNLYQPKYRRFAYCFDNMENYLSAMDGFMTQSYPKLKRTEDFYIRHYCWFQPEPYKQLRYELIHRSNPQYWIDFEKGLQEIRENTQKYIDSQNAHEDSKFIPANKILIRPSRQDEAKWAQLVLDIEHPEAIKNHQNFVK